MRVLIIASIFLISAFSQAKLPSDCDCPEVKCSNPCERQDGVTFYTAKCAEGKRVKSCAKPTCVMMGDDPTAECISYRAKTGKRAIASEKKKSKKKVVEYVAPAAKVGRVNLVKGKAWIKSENGAQKFVKMGLAVRETDTVITSNSGKVKVKFNDGNILSVLPNTQTKISRVQDSAKHKQTLIDLIKGKVRSRVVQKYKGANYYKVRTRSAVAGVRGTDFVVSYEVTGKAITKVQTINGAVDLKSGDQKQSQSIVAGHEGTFVVAANLGDVFSENEISEFISRGYMTPVYKMTAEEVKKLSWDTDVEKDKTFEHAVAHNAHGDEICSAPRGKLNQCQWNCVNNPRGESRCRTDLPQVNCVRKRCNANGDWSDDARLPASYYDMCRPKGVRIGPCDY